MFDRVQQALQRAIERPGFGYAVLFMDFDRFKQVNDTLGHAVGDELLRQIAQRLRSTLRAGDVIGRNARYEHTAGRTRSARTSCTPPPASASSRPSRRPTTRTP